MPKKKLEVATANVYPGHYGFRYTCRDGEGKVIYDSENFFRSRRDARAEILRRWPRTKVSFEVR